MPLTKIDPVCVLCGAAITHATDSAEHVLPNAIGYRQKMTWSDWAAAIDAIPLPSHQVRNSPTAPA